MDDLKGAAKEEVADCFMDVLEADFGKLTRQKRKFEHTGVWHEQLPNGDVACTQDHYAKQLQTIPTEHSEGDDVEITNTPMQTAFWSLLGGAAWMTVTRADVAVHIGHLQRQTHKPLWKHVKQLNAVVRWMKRKPSS